MFDAAFDLLRRAAIPKGVKGMGAISRVLASAGITEHDCRVAGHFARALLENPASEKYLLDAEISLLQAKASGESIGGTGGVLVAPEIEDSIIALRDNNGIARRFAHVIQMGSDERHWPRRVAGVTARFVVPENAAIAD